MMSTTDNSGTWWVVISTDYLIIKARINYVDLPCKSQKGLCLLKLNIVSVFQRRVYQFKYQSASIELQERLERIVIDILLECLQQAKSSGKRSSGLGMNIPGAWRKGYTGKGVVVTVLDDGIERFHPDLLQNYVSHHHSPVIVH